MDVTEYWRRCYVDDISGLCSLCGNRGQIDTRATAISNAGVKCGGIHYCFCPNGQAMRASAGRMFRDIKVPAAGQRRTE